MFLSNVLKKLFLIPLNDFINVHYVLEKFQSAFKVSLIDWLINWLIKGRNLGWLIGSRGTQVDYTLLCCDLKEMSDYKVVVGKSLARQHRMLLVKLIVRNNSTAISNVM